MAKENFRKETRSTGRQGSLPERAYSKQGIDQLELVLNKELKHESLILAQDERWRRA